MQPNDKKPADITFNQKTSLIIIGAIATPILIFLTIGLYAPQVLQSLFPQPVKDKPAQPACLSASGNLYSGIQLYRDSTCSGSPAFTVMGGNPGNSLVKLQAPSSAPEWKQRSVVTSSFYVKTTDPAFSTKQWLEYKN